MEILQPSMGLQTCSTYTTLHDTTVTTMTTGFMGKSQSLLMTREAHVRDGKWKLEGSLQLKAILKWRRSEERRVGKECVP